MNTVVATDQHSPEGSREPSRDQDQDQDQDQVHLPGPPRVFLSENRVNIRDHYSAPVAAANVLPPPPILTDVPEVDDEPRHQRQILILKDEHRCRFGFGTGRSRPSRGLTLDFALMKTWFSMSVLDLLCAVPAFLIASSLHRTLVRNRNRHRHRLQTHAPWTFGTASALLPGTGRTSVPLAEPSPLRTLTR